MDQEKFGRLIKEIRKKNNLTQKDLADKYNVTYQAVSKWENGKNMPDMVLIKQISKDYNIPLEDVLEGNYKHKKKNIIKPILIILVLSIISICLISVFTSNDNFEFKTLSTSCDNFKIRGSISYNDNKSAIYITDIEYCKEEDSILYKNINCTLYEKSEKTITEISKDIYKEEKAISLDEYLNSITFSIDNYNRICKNYDENSLYLEINATDSSNKVTTYNIPLTLNDNC